MTERISGSSLAILLMLLALLSGCDFIIGRIGGNFAGKQPSSSLPAAARKLVDAAFKGLDADRLVDHHVHILSYSTGLAKLCGGIGDTGAYVTPDRESWLHPYWKIATDIVQSASGVTNRSDFDHEYAARLLELVKNYPGKGVFKLLALDAYYAFDETTQTFIPDWTKTDLYIPNRFVVETAACLNRILGETRFEPVISVHPLRPDALQELAKWHAGSNGLPPVRTIKWLPNIQNIDPSDVRNIPFYDRVAALEMTIMTHTGNEQALRAFHGEHQAFANPLLLDLPLRRGVRIVMAHMGREGESGDGGAARPNFELVLKMMKNPDYRGCLYSDISALTIRSRETLDYLWTVMDKDYLKGRLLNGSDYPLPGVWALNPTAVLADKGAITTAQADALDDIYRRNPLLFDFVVKRTIRRPKAKDDKGERLRLPAEVFYAIEDAKGGGYGCRPRLP